MSEYKELERELEVAHHVWRKTNKRPLMRNGTGPFRSACAMPPSANSPSHRPSLLRCSMAALAAEGGRHRDAEQAPWCGVRPRQAGAAEAPAHNQQCVVLRVGASLFVSLSLTSLSGLGFVRFDTQVTATIAAQIILSKNRFRFNSVPAPVRRSIDCPPADPARCQDPRDVVWEHVHIGHVQRGFRKTFAYAVFAAMVVFWMIPGANDTDTIP